jgi:hypothetical protein
LVGVDDMMLAILWTHLDAQGFGVKECMVYQDNKSAILLEKNDQASSSKQTKHINIHYFFVTNRINLKKGKVSVKWCVTDAMFGDFWTKPTKGNQFTCVRDQIMGAVDHQQTKAVLESDVQFHSTWCVRNFPKGQLECPESVNMHVN